MQTETFNFNRWKARCHYLGELLTKAKGNSYKHQLLAAEEKWEETNAKFLAMPSKTNKAAAKAFDSMEKLQEKIKILRPLINVFILSQTAKSRLQRVFTEVTTGRYKDIKGKYIEKGLKMEESAITMYCIHTGEIHSKNKVRKENDWLEGEVDIDDILGELIIDTKCSWDIFSFDAVAYKPTNPIYKWQLKGYCFIFDRVKARLAYCLLNTPAALIATEKRRLLNEFVGTQEDYEEACKEIDFLHTYDDLPLERKIRIFEVDKSEEDELLIISCIEACRVYLNSIGKEHLRTALDEAEEEETE